MNGSGRDITAVQVATFEDCQAKGDETQAQGANAVTMITNAHGTMTCYIKQVGYDSTERSLPEATSMKLCTSAAGHTGPDVIITLPGNATDTGPDKLGVPPFHSWCPLQPSLLSRYFS